MPAGPDPADGGKFVPLWPLAIAAPPFVLLATLNSGGYRYGAADLAFYIPAVLARLNPGMFPRDADLIASQARLTTIDEVLAAASRLSGLSLPPLLAAAYAGTLVLLAAAVWLLASRLYRTTAAVVAATAAMTLRHAISRSGTNTLEGYFHPRQVAFALGTLALAALLRGRRATLLLLIAAAALVHPTTALWFAIWAALAVAVEDRRARVPLAAAVAVAAVAALWLLTWGPLAGRLVIMDPEWLATLATKDYLFPLAWPADVWLVNLAYAPLIVWIYRRRRTAGVLVAHETGLVAGCVALVALFALSLPFNAARVALAVQLQVPRVFWMLDLLATLYVVWAVAEGANASARRGWSAAAVIAAASLGRGAYVVFVKFPERSVAQLRVADTDWGRVMAWARTTTPVGSGWIADPLHAVRYGTSLRVAGQRDVFVEAVKDAAIGMYARQTAIRTRDHLAALHDFDRLTAERARSLAAREGLDYLVTEAPLDLPVAFRSGRLAVYRLR